MEQEIVEWSPLDMVEVTIKQPDDFLKIRETLTRIGVASRKEMKLFQSCHILHKQGRYFVVHFKKPTPPPPTPPPAPPPSLIGDQKH